MTQKYVGTITLRRTGKRVILTVTSSDIGAGLMLPTHFGVRSLHFGTKLRGMNILKGEGYGWDGHDYVRARRQGNKWVMNVPVRDNDPKKKQRLFVRGNCYIRSYHNEIYYFDLKKWKVNPAHARIPGILDVNLETIPT